MTVSFITGGGRPSTVKNTMTELQTRLLAAGWTIVYADADAIGTGSKDAPAWNKAPAVSKSAGTAVYQMPANAGQPTAWCVQLNPVWDNPLSMIFLRVRVALGCAPDGTLKTSGSLLEFIVANQNDNYTEWYASAYEHGLLLSVHGQFGQLLCVERRREMDGTVIDDVIVYGASQGSPGYVKVAGDTGPGWGYGFSLARSAIGGEYAPQLWAVFAGSQGNSAPYTLNRRDGITGVPQGPFSVSNNLAGVPRLFQLMPPNDTPAGVDVTINIDGANRAYYAAQTQTPAPSGMAPRIVYAKR